MRYWVVVVTVLTGIACSGRQEGPASNTAQPAGPAPARYRVPLETSKGRVTIEVIREWSPAGADRFHQLVKAGFFDGARFFRVVPGFVVQFGLAADPAVTAKWNGTEFPDDPPGQSNARGTVTFATRGPNTRTTQIFINLGNNGMLDAQGFTPFGRVVEGMEAVDRFHSGYGEAPQQPLITMQGNAYLQQQFPDLDFIKTARVGSE